MDYSRILYGEILFRPAKGTGVDNQNVTPNTSSNGTPTNTIPEWDTNSDPNLRLDWMQIEKIGGGLINVGNTCFLNSVLQCLTYCPPLYNFLVKLNGGHSSSCKINQFCMLCEMEKHVKQIRSSTGSAIKPMSIVQRLRYINKSFQFGRQEDAHEFLRYIIDHMWKACLQNLDNNNVSISKLDPKIKESTVINRIFGGYHRSQVLCLSCNSRSDTFDFFMDFILDIRNAQSLEDALKKFTRAETLENENAYKCSKCKKKVTAKKRFTVYRAPNVATFQLKRFDSDRIFGGKITKYINYPEELDLGPFMSDPSKCPIKYQLSAVLVHLGHSSNSGHYFCFIRNSNNFWYRMDDSTVSLVTLNTVLQQQAYVLFYTRKSSCDSKQPIKTVKTEVNNKTPQKISDYFAPVSSNNIHDNHQSSNNGNANNRANVLQNHSEPHNLKTKQTPALGSPSAAAPVVPGISTWNGSKSKLGQNGSTDEITERDQFNEEIDRGKTKKIKKSRDDRFASMSKSNPFQRYTGNGYQQYKEHKNDHNYRRHDNSHMFGRHRNKHFHNRNKFRKT